MESGAVVAPPHVASPLHLAPFRGLRLPGRRVGDAGTLRQLSRVTRGGGMSSWRDRSMIEQDPEPSLYLHEYTAGGLTVRGLVGALDISHRARTLDERAVFPHEGIRPVQADDLADRMEELALNPTPILLVHHASDAYREILHRCTAPEPDREFTDRHDQHHRIWIISDPAAIAALNDTLTVAHALIADGHHRYAAYLRMQSRRPGGAADRGLAMLVDQATTPLFLGPIHRSLSGVSLEDVASAATASGHHFETLDRPGALARLGPHALVATDGTEWGVILLATAGDRADVEMLHDDVLPALPRGPQSIHYLHTFADALKAARRSRRVSVLMPAPDVEQILRVVESGRLLPHKATSFQPKPSAGVLIRSLHDE